MSTQDKGKTEMHDQGDLAGLKPFSSIGPDNTEIKKVVGKLKQKKTNSLRAKGSTFKEGIKANAGIITDAISKFTV